MALINLSDSRRIAMERIRTVIRQEIGTEITASIAATSLALECPAPTGVFVQSEVDFTTIARAHKVFVTIAPGESRRVEATASGGVDTYKMVTKIPFDVALAYQIRPQAPILVGGIPLEINELMLRRGEVYLSALINVIFKYACEGSAIHDLEFISDQPDLLQTDSGPVWGLAQLAFNVTQNVAVPARRPLPPTP